MALGVVINAVKRSDEKNKKQSRPKAEPLTKNDELITEN
jgi:hypothetical protein